MDHSAMGDSTMGDSTMDHSEMGMDHAAMMKASKSAPSALLIEAGNDAFGTVQEVVRLLSNDPDTDWSKVNLEALRLHLLDMEDMVSNVKVLSQTPIDYGMVAVVKPTTNRASEALKRIFMAHPQMLKSESGFDMKVGFDYGQYTLTTTTSNPADVDKIRGLGYIGLMAFGSHHQAHHVSIAKGHF
jgi:hypothetical protein